MHSNTCWTPLWLMFVRRTSSTFRCFSTHCPPCPFLRSIFIVSSQTHVQFARCNSWSRRQLLPSISMVFTQNSIPFIFNTCRLLKSHPFSKLSTPPSVSNLPAGWCKISQCKSRSTNSFELCRNLAKQLSKSLTLGLVRCEWSRGELKMGTILVQCS